MNFLSHFYLASKLEAPFYHAGVSSPDWIGIFSGKGSNELKKIQHPETTTENEKDFIFGLIAHFQTDKAWHSSEYFNEKTMQLNEIFRKSLGPGKHRTFFLSHLWLELALDRMIVLNNPQVAENYYSQIGLVHAPELRKLIEQKGVPVGHKFEQYLNSFLMNKYLFQYGAMEGFRTAMEKTCIRVGLSPFSAFTQTQFEELLSECDILIEKDFILGLESVPSLG